MTQRNEQIEVFLSKAGWQSATRDPVPGDASTRRYVRLKQAGHNAILMDAPIESEKVNNGYNLVAKLSNNNPAAFTAIAQSLAQYGFRAPKILAADLPAGLILLEDLGDSLFVNILEKSPELEPQIYQAAIDCLAAIYRCVFSPKVDSFGQEWEIRCYDDAALLAETRLMLEWYLPYRGAILTETHNHEWDEIWQSLWPNLRQHAPGLVLRDFHAQNVFWLSDQAESPQRAIGLIDFQDALLGHPAYDLVSLIEDARRDVDPALSDPLISRFCEKAKIPDDERFRTAYAIMGAQRNAKILGIFVRLAKRDGKGHYLNLLPRVEQHFFNNLQHGSLAPLAGWLTKVLQ